MKKCEYCNQKDAELLYNTMLLGFHFSANLCGDCHLNGSTEAMITSIIKQRAFQLNIDLPTDDSILENKLGTIQAFEKALRENGPDPGTDKPRS